MRSDVSVSPELLRVSVLSEDQIRRLHLAALEVLRRTGVRFHHQGAVDALREAGAFVFDGNLVKMSAAMVEDAIESAPCRIVMCDRDGNPAMFLEGMNTYFGTGSDCLNLIDPETGERLEYGKALPAKLMKYVDKRYIGVGFWRIIDRAPPDRLDAEIRKRLAYKRLVYFARCLGAEYVDN